MNIEWRVLSMKCFSNLDGLTDVVYEINWLCYATVDTFDGATQGFVCVQYNPDVPYTPFNELTQDQVLVWVKNAMGEVAVIQAEEQAATFANEKANPKTVTPPLPWN
jgi:hypothetical protein